MHEARLDAADLQTWETEFASLDGLRLVGTQVAPPNARHTAVFAQGGDMAGDDQMLLPRLALGLARQGIASFRFDLRGYGASGGRQEALTLSGLVNDIRAAVEVVGLSGEQTEVCLVGAGLWAGASVLFAARYPELIRRLVLLGPLIDYKRAFVDETFSWTEERITEEAGRELEEEGFVAHAQTLRLGRPLLNEVFHLRPDEAIRRVITPTLVVHGSADAVVPVEHSRTAIRHVVGQARLLEVDGATHGFTVPGDPGYRDPRTKGWQALVVRSIAEWIKGC